MLTSLFESNKDNRFEIFLMHDGSLSKQNVRKLNLLGKKNGCLIRLIEVHTEKISHFSVHPTSHEITMPTFYRLLSVDLLPKSIHKVLYLDCDVIVEGNVRSLWDTNLDGYAVAAVKDCCFQYNKQTYKRLNYSRYYGYFNAGVLMMNLDYWRDYQLSEKIIEFSQNGKPDQLWMMDQDIINAVLYSKKMFVSERFNFQTEFFLRSFWDTYPTDFKNKIISECEKKILIHYCGSMKPWQRCYNKDIFYSQWDYYRKKSLWRCCRTWKPFLKNVKYILKKIFLPSRLKEIWVMCN
jgi:lipopolysaccharide biosynthesis glycosyltransferase